MRSFASCLFAVVALATICLAQAQDAKAAPGAFVDVNGGRLYFEECGTGNDAVILMHDGVANSAVWDFVWPEFCKRFHTIRYDRRGYGRSPEAKNAYFEADDLAALINNRKIKKAALVGASHGGQVAMEFTVRYPEFVSHLVVVAPGATGFPYSEHYLMREYANQQTKDVAKQIEQTAQDQFLTLPGHDAARKKLREILTASPQDLTHNDMPLFEKPTFPSVAQVRVPTLILIGSGDIADNQAVAGALLVSIPGSFRNVLPDTGHLIYLEKPQEFFGQVADFLTLHGFGH